MTPGLRQTTTLAAISLAILAGCKSSERRAAEAARNNSQLAASAEQKKLWQDVADKGAAPGLERVPVVQEPVERRQRPTGGKSAPVPAQPITIPPAVLNSIRIVDYPAEPAKSYEGPATVVGTAGDLIRLDLGSKRSLSVLARVNKGSIPVAMGETVRVAYMSQRGPQDQHTVIGILTAAGAGIVNVVQAGLNPVTVNVPLFNITAKQGTQPTSLIGVSGPNFSAQDMSPGAIATVGKVTVFIVGSAGGQGPGVALIEGKPYALNVMVWKVP